MRLDASSNNLDYPRRSARNRTDVACRRMFYPAKRLYRPIRVAIVLGSLAVWSAGCVLLALGEEDDEFPSFEEVNAAVWEHFDDKSGWRPGDLISRSDAEEIFEILDDLGWWIEDQESISDQVLADRAYLVRKLRSRSGTRFMRRIAKYPQVYDRLDRLSHLSSGRKLVSDLISDKNGYEMVKYLSTSRGGKNLGRMLKNGKRGSNLNLKTGRIYTVRQLLDVLSDVYEEAKEAKEAEEAEEDDEDDNGEREDGGDEDEDDDEEDAKE